MESSGHLKNSKGAVAPLVAIMLVVIILCVAIVVDLGHIHNVKIQLQRAVDAAALAGANALPDEDAAVDSAVAVAGANRVDREGVEIDPADVVLGIWDKEALGDSADERFDSDLKKGETPNAVKVTASRDVDHIFFFFADSTAVTADAIAVNIFEKQTFPFILVSCIQTDNTFITPGSNACDIEYFKWGSDPTDTGGWTSLTYRPINKPAVENFFSDEGIERFNRIIYGTDESHDGLENESVKAGPIPFSPTEYDKDPADLTASVCNEQNVQLTIRCGLGADFNTTAPPTPVDPLGFGHENPTSLPRWDSDDPNHSDPFDKAVDHFTRVWSQDGILLPQSGESTDKSAPGFAAFEARMADLKAASISGDYTAYNSNPAYDIDILPPFDDGRFSKLIDQVPGYSDTAPLYEEALRYAGYPLVEIMNGVVNAALQDFLDDVVTEGTNTFRSALTEDNEPFDPAGSIDSNGLGATMQLILPVIFTGRCDSTKFLKGMPYIGLSNLLVTRIWRGTNDGYDVGSDAVTVTGTPPCPFPDFNPPAPETSGDQFIYIKGKGAGIEGLVRPPTKGEETQTGIRKIYLVE
jgi:hypothetical protein